ncbi:glyoxylate/hydroxypyruvate reductase A [Pseudooceanicola sediminis]|uniref:Glyoxylate/hydroxypyruvate reductase A n=1 Tax=Pseudooceanicola sediminis TaxID=2211117 RepID=A0A399IZV3_9RHOB|nr:glyoxylate/hydroxypyruvate reductase A [Pseudooceanicola sediminis]RII37937.1 glyoxylate/hydroxypyruvate reductase A [Pseudooceanicola sediminis]|tara:strand:- start:35768 stop:36697 length:930 start_codon:yes stop_codon:yes gene_type:complete
MINVLYAATSPTWEEYEAPLRRAFDAAGLPVTLSRDIAPEQVDYIVYAPKSDLTDFTPYTNTKAVLNLWAGVEGIVGNQTLTQPLCRMVDHGLERGMIEWVTGHTLRHHLDIDYFLARQSGSWEPFVPPLAQDRPVTVLGLGELGRACAVTLSQLGFPVTGWSRTQKQIDGLTCLSGPDGLEQALSTAQILILLLPLTAETTDLLDSTRLAQLPKGACILNPGRGPLIVDAALIAALDSGQIARATLDVFRQEPLPPEHPFWAHPQVTVCPHIASETRASTAAEVIAENIRRGEAGEDLLFRVDRTRGY